MSNVRPHETPEDRPTGRLRLAAALSGAGVLAAGLGAGVLQTTAQDPVAPVDPLAGPAPAAPAAAPAPAETPAATGTSTPVSPAPDRAAARRRRPVGRSSGVSCGRTFDTQPACSARPGPT